MRNCPVILQQIQKHFMTQSTCISTTAATATSDRSLISSSLQSAKLFIKKKFVFDSSSSSSSKALPSSSTSTKSIENVHSSSTLSASSFNEKSDAYVNSARLSSLELIEKFSSSSASETIEITQVKATKSKKTIYDLVIGSSYLSKRNIAEQKFDSSNLSVTNTDGKVRPDCGEDAFFFMDTPRYSCLGVADGVGGWNSFGINPALFAWELMECCQTACLRNSVPYPWQVLEEAYDQVKNEGKIEAGSSTACIISFDKINAILHSANLGDSGFLVLRLAEDEYEFGDDGKDSSSTSSSGSEFDEMGTIRQTLDPGNVVKYQSKALQHYFNAPYQLAILPSSFTYLQRANYMNDHPRVAHKCTNGPLKSGDVIIMATDGLFDNLFVEEMIECVQTGISEFYQELMKQNANVDLLSNNIRLLLQERIQNTAHEMVSRAAYKSVSENPSPFSQEAKLNGWLDAMGGKLDDVTVLIGIVVSKEYEEPLASL